MNKIILVVLAVIVLGGGGLVVVLNKKDKGAESHNHSQHSEGHEASAPNNNQTSTESSDNNEVREGQVAINIKEYAYNPSSLKIKKGTTVTWTNEDSVQHDIMPDQDGDFTASELLSKGQSYSFTFNEVGKFSYHCSPHPYMKASIEVVE